MGCTSVLRYLWAILIRISIHALIVTCFNGSQMSEPLGRSKSDSLIAMTERFGTNWKRCVALLMLIQDPKFSDLEKQALNQTGMDLIRATVVLFHASFEDLLREACRKFWLIRPSDKWTAVPFVGERGDDRRTKLTIIDLAQFRGMTVDDLIQKWFDSWINRETYNNFADVVQLLETLEIDKQPFQKYATHVDFLMKRRHRIVHSVDFDHHAATGPADWPTSDIYKFLIATHAVHSISIELMRAMSEKPLDVTAMLEHSRNEASIFVDRAELRPSDQFPFT
jgi:hypothetical protein